MMLTIQTRVQHVHLLQNVSSIYRIGSKNNAGDENFFYICIENSPLVKIIANTSHLSHPTPNTSPS